jgi:cytochrome c oxidase cbb3-type subunit 3
MHWKLHAGSFARSRVVWFTVFSQAVRARRDGPSLLSKLAFLSCFVAAAAFASSSQSAAAQEAASSSKGNGPKLFESTCAVCHGLDGAGGEHAPNIARASRARSLPDAKLTQIIRDGVIGKGMPAFNRLGDEKIRAIVRELRSLQGKSATRIASGNPARGKELFFGNAGCADCHAMNGEGRFVATDLTDFAYSHDSDEIQDAILNPQGQGIPSMVFVAVVTKSGQQFSGMARNENNSSVQMQDSEGRFFLFAKSDIRSVERSAGPAMPEDYRQRLTATEIIDIVSYIVQQTSVRGISGSQAAKGNKRSKE